MGASETVNISENEEGLFDINIKVATDSVWTFTYIMFPLHIFSSEGASNGWSTTLHAVNSIENAKFSSTVLFQGILCKKTNKRIVYLNYC